MVKCALFFFLGLVVATFAPELADVARDVFEAIRSFGRELFATVA
jgi:hypothetical protein